MFWKRVWKEGGSGRRRLEVKEGSGLRKEGEEFGSGGMRMVVVGEEKRKRKDGCGKGSGRGCGKNSESGDKGGESGDSFGRRSG